MKSNLNVLILQSESLLSKSFSVDANMLRTTLRRAAHPVTASVNQIRQVNMAAMATASQDKREGDISDSFASLAGVKDEPLPDQFRQLKLSLVQGREQKIIASWNRLLRQLQVENDTIAELGPKVIPEVYFDDLDRDIVSLKDEIKKRGAAVIRGVIPEDEARGYKHELEDYIRKNPQTKGNHLPSFAIVLSILNLYLFPMLTIRRLLRFPPKRSTSLGALLVRPPAPRPSSSQFHACARSPDAIDMAHVRPKIPHLHLPSSLLRRPSPHPPARGRGLRAGPAHGRRQPGAVDAGWLRERRSVRCCVRRGVGYEVRPLGC